LPGQLFPASTLFRTEGSPKSSQVLFQQCVNVRLQSVHYLNVIILRYRSHCYLACCKIRRRSRKISREKQLAYYQWLPKEERP